MCGRYVPQFGTKSEKHTLLTENGNYSRVTFGIEGRTPCNFLHPIFYTFNLLCDEIVPQSKALLKTLLVAKYCQEIHTLCGIWKSITLFETACY